MSSNTSTTITLPLQSPLSFHANFFNQRKISIQKKIDAQLACIPAQTLESINNFSNWKVELENVSLYWVTTLALRVVDACIKFFNLNYTPIRDLLDSHYLAQRLITNYSQLINPSSLEYPVFKQECQNQENLLAPLIALRLSLAQKLVKEFKSNLIATHYDEAKRQYQAFPEWLKGSIKELILTRRPKEEAVENALGVLIERSDEFPPLIDQFSKVLEDQTNHYSQFSSTQSEEQTHGLIRSIESNDHVMDHFLNQRVSSDKDALFDPSIDRVLRKVPASSMQDPIRVTMVGVEYAGLCKEGGLAEALEGMSRGILELNPANKVSLVFPKYSHLPQNILNQMRDPTTHVDSRGDTYRVFTQEINGVHCHFIEDPLFVLSSKKPKIYDDKEHQRFARFSGLAADFIYERKETDIVHLHDWHVSGVALKLKKDHKEEWKAGQIPPVVFTFHNNNKSSQGRVSLGPYCYDPVIEGYVKNGILDDNDNLFVKTLKVADQITTVSKSFAWETQKVEKGHGVAFAVKSAAKMGKFAGILNGNNPSRFDPQKDNSLIAWKSGNLSYGVNHPQILEQKQKSKTEFARWVQTYLPDTQIDPSKPWMGYIGRFDSTQKGLDKFEESIEAALKNGGQFICMGVLEDAVATKILDRLQEKYKNGVVFIRDRKQPNGKFFYQDGDGIRPGIGSIVRAALDFMVIPSSYEPCGLVQFEGWLFGALAIGSNTGGLADTITPLSENRNTFNGFLFDRDKKGELTETIAQALRFWSNLPKQEKEATIRRVMVEGKKNGWNDPSFKEKFSPAEQYRIIYANAKARQKLRKSNGSFDLIDALRHKHVSAPDTAHPQFQANEKQEEYFQNFYSKYRDRGVQEALYRKLPQEIRSNFPHPYGKDVHYQKHEKCGAFSCSGGVQFSTRFTGSNVSLVLLNDDLSVQREIPMHRSGDQNWGLSIPGAKEGQKYQFRVDGIIKVDPYGRRHGFYPGEEKSYSVVDFGNYEWTDAQWMATREKNAGRPQPMSIYEMHLNTWKKEASGKSLNYRQLAVELADHCQRTGYTHVELMGLLEHPNERSWGYQVSGYFSPNHRLGSVQDFKYMIDYLHKRNIGVIIDWVPAHFANNDYLLDESFKASGLRYRFSWRRKFYNFGSHQFDFGNKEVRDFLISSAHFWMKEMHLDGLRLDCLPSISESEDKISADLFLRDLNAVIHKHRGVFSIAEDYSGDGRVTLPYYKNGLGFDMKWHVDWGRKSQGYFRSPISGRKTNYDVIQNTLMGDVLHRQVVYLSHDEANAPLGWVDHFAHIENVEEREANMRTFWSLLMSVPGKKLNFMGYDWANETPFYKFIEEQFPESTTGLQNGLKPWHRNKQQLLSMVQELHRIYRSNKSLYERDNNGNDMDWIEDPQKQVHAFRRQANDGTSMACFHNLTDQSVESFVISVPKSKKPALSPREIFSSDAVAFGGKGRRNQNITTTETPDAVQYTVSIPPFSSVIVDEGRLKVKKMKAVDEEGQAPSVFTRIWNRLIRGF